MTIWWLDGWPHSNNKTILAQLDFHTGTNLEKTLNIVLWTNLREITEPLKILENCHSGIFENIYLVLSVGWGVGWTRI